MSEILAQQIEQMFLALQRLLFKLKVSLHHQPADRPREPAARSAHRLCELQAGHDAVHGVRHKLRRGRRPAAADSPHETLALLQLVHCQPVLARTSGAIAG